MDNTCLGSDDVVPFVDPSQEDARLHSGIDYHTPEEYERLVT